jgi:2-polyprenyl-3-methyl-5-hydroxy-6-metoxy-1,4-benzoquinol methylase
MAENKYLASSLSVRADQERLALMEQTFDQTTIRHLETLGVTSGWVCLEVGAGYGSISCWLENRVGLKGKVVATDLRPELHRKVGNTVEIRKHDILQDDIEKNHYDLVHCRTLLQHLSNPKLALTNMAEAVRPGGWLMIEELDNCMLPVSDHHSPSLDMIYKNIHNFLEITRSKGTLDPEFGRHVRPLLEQLQFEEIGNEGFTQILRGGEPWLKSQRLIMGVWRALVTGESAEETKMRAFCDEAERLLDDPSFYCLMPAFFTAWGRKPLKWVAPKN